MLVRQLRLSVLPVYCLLGLSCRCLHRRPFLVSLHVLPCSTVIVDSYEVYVCCCSKFFQDTRAYSSPGLLVGVKGALTSTGAAISSSKVACESASKALARID